MVYISFAEKIEENKKIRDEIDPKSAPIDSFSYGTIVK